MCLWRATPSWAVFILSGHFLSDRERSPQRCAFSKEGLFVGHLNLHMTLNLTYQLIKTDAVGYKPINNGFVCTTAV